MSQGNSHQPMGSTGMPVGPGGAGRGMLWSTPTHPPPGTPNEGPAVHAPPVGRLPAGSLLRCGAWLGARGWQERGSGLGRTCRPAGAATSQQPPSAPQECARPSQRRALEGGAPDVAVGGCIRQTTVGPRVRDLESGTPSGPIGWAPHPFGRRQAPAGGPGPRRLGAQGLACGWRQPPTRASETCTPQRPLTLPHSRGAHGKGF
mmetsp:Transcript_120104/g.209083  ORF Transcript_120104/g.209083 Transcript_120104/m.209083 type:complete len:204 (-) Transcript_120104:268-879(-)